MWIVLNALVIYYGIWIVVVSGQLWWS